MGSSHSSGSRRSSGGSLSRPNVHRQRTPEEQTLVGMLEAVFAVMEEPKGKLHNTGVTEIRFIELHDFVYLVFVSVNTCM